MNFKCEKCGNEIDSPAKAYVRVTGWGKPNSKGNVKDIFGASKPHGHLCLDCGFTLKNKQVDQTGSLF